MKQEALPSGECRVEVQDEVDSANILRILEKKSRRNMAIFLKRRLE